MAFGQNIPQNFGQTISTVADAQRNTQFQTALQQRFDVNSAKIDEAIQKVSSIPLYREKDKEYLKNKVSGVLNQVNSNLKVSGGESLLNNNLTGNITKLVGSSIDNYLVEQMGISAQKQQFDTQMSEVQKKNPEKFSSVNYAFALDQAGWEDYMNGSKDSLKSGFVYTPFQDVQMNVAERVKKILDAKGGGEKVTEYLDGVGGKKIETLKGLSAQEVMAFMPGILTELDRQQIKIDGWAMGKNDPQGTKVMFDALVTENIKDTQDYLEEQESLSNDMSLSAEARSVAQSKADATRKQLEALNSQKSTTDVGLMGYTVKEFETKQHLKNLMLGTTSITYDDDKAFNENAKRIEKQRKQEEKANPSLAPDSFIGTVQEEQELSPVETYSKVKQSHDVAFRKVVGKALNALEDKTISDAKKTAFKNDLKNYGFIVKTKQNGEVDIVLDPTWTGKKGTKAMASVNAYIKAGLGKTENDYYEIKSAYDDKNTLASALVKANEEFSKDVDTDGLVDDMAKASYTLKNTYFERLVDLPETLDYITTFTEEGAKNLNFEKRKAEAEKIDKFIETYGGVEKLKEQVRNNPALAEQVVRLQNKAADADVLITRVGTNLTKEMNNAGEKLKTLGVLPKTQDKYNIQITNKEARDKLVSRIDQTLPVQGNAFDLDRPITTKANYDSRGNIESFTIMQQARDMDKKDGDFRQKPSSMVKVAYNSAAGQMIMSTVSQANNKDAMFFANDAKINPIRKIISEPFPSSITQTENLFDGASGLIGSDLGMTMVGNLANADKTKMSAKDTAKMYAKAQLVQTYQPQEIDALYNKIEQGFKNGDFDVALIPNKLPSQNTAKWVVDVKYKGQPILTENYTSSSKLSEGQEKAFRSYPQFEVLKLIVDQYKKGNQILQ
jgi:hypothetical protein